MPAAHDPATLMRIRNLELRARTVIDGLWTGIHRSDTHGFSAEFAEYRHYQPGDDIRTLDWKLYARSDRTYVRRYEEDTSLSCTLLVDRSRSMNFTSLTYTKADLARTLAATFALYLRGQGDATGLLTFSDQVHDYLPPSTRPAQIHALILALESANSGTSTDLTQPLERIAALIRRRSLVIILSDLLVPTEALEHRLSLLAARGHEVVLFQILDPAEINFTFADATIFEDLETGTHHPTDPTTVRDAYLKNFNTHQTTLSQLCQRIGITHHLFPTDQPLATALYQYLKTRQTHRRIRRTSNKA